MARLILFNKPYRVLSQFTSGHKPQELDPNPSLGEKTKRNTLADFIDQKSVYPAGRLDYDSEGLLLLTDDGGLQHKISHPQHKLAKTYWVQLEGAPDSKAIEKLKTGVTLKDGVTGPAKVSLIDPPSLWERDPPVRFREKIPTHWVEVTITEGRNRQVRRMTAAVGLPTLRLIRYSIGEWNIENLQPGDWSELTIQVPHTNKPSPRRQAKKKSHYNRRKK